MIIEKEKVHIWTDNGTRIYYKKKNIDTKELTKWMRELAGIEAFGLQELPIWKGKAKARFVVLDSLQQGSCVITYSVMENGLKRNFIPINSKRFTNNAHCTFLSALSKDKVMTSILKHKDGKRVKSDGKARIQKWINDWFAYKEQGGYQYDPIRVIINAGEVGIELKEDYTMEDLRNACEYAIKTSGYFTQEDFYPEQESFGYMSGHKPEVYTTY